MSFSRFVATMKIVLFGHILNWPWRSRVKRRAVRSDVISKVIPTYFKRYLPAVKNVADGPVIKDDKNEKIFTIWQQGEENAPELVKSCFRSIRKHCKQELVVLDDSNIFDYIKLPDVIVEKYRAGKIRRAHFADICRVELLYQYGGFWLDSTDFVVSEIPQWIVDTDFFMFLVGEKVGQKYMFCQNCFIRGRRGSYLLGAWRAMILAYWMNEQKSFDYFIRSTFITSICFTTKNNFQISP